MAKLEYNVISNPTLDAVSKALEDKQKLERVRNYLGASAIGDECWRKLFYNFRGVAKRDIPSSGLRAINDGFMQEDLMI